MGNATLTVTAATPAAPTGQRTRPLRHGYRPAERRHLYLRRDDDRDSASAAGHLRDRSDGDGDQPGQLHRGLQQRHPDGRQRHPDGDGGERQPRLRGSQPGVYRHDYRRSRTATPSPSPRHDGDSARLPGPTRSFRRRRGPTWPTTPWSTTTDPDGRERNPDGDGGERQPRLRGSEPGVYRHGYRRSRTATPSPSPRRRQRLRASAAGTYAIVPTATGTNLANYTVVYNNGTLTVGTQP